MKLRRIFGGQAFAWALAIVLLAGCAAAPSKTTSQLQAEVRASTMVNPNLEGKASPVVVYILALRGPGQFERADLIQIIDGPAAALGADLVSFTQDMVMPGQTKQIQLSLPDEVAYVAGVAALRDYSGRKWKDIVPVDKGRGLGSGRDRTLVFEVDVTGVRLNLR